MPHSVDPKQTTRASAYEFWMNAPNPMVTFIKTIDVTRLVRTSKRNGLKSGEATRMACSIDKSKDLTSGYS